MNDHDLNDIFQSYRNAVTVPATIAGPTTTPVKRKNTVLFLRLGAVAAGIAILAAATVLLPNRPRASAYAQMVQAMNNFESFHLDLFRKSSFTPWHLTMVWEGQGDYRRCNFLIGSDMERTTLVDGTSMVTWQKNKPYAVKTTLVEPDEMDSTNGIDYVESLMNGSKGGFHEATNPLAPADVTVLKGTFYQGSRKCEIWVDKQTHLPRVAFLSQHRSNGYSQDRYEFQWNKRIPESEFSPASLPVPVRDADAERAALLKKWAKPLATLDTPDGPVHVRAVITNPEGSIFVVSSSTAKNPNLNGMPHSFYVWLPSTLTDQQGRKYLLQRDYTPGGLDGNDMYRNACQINGENLQITPFVCLAATPPQGPLTITYKNRTLVWTASSELTEYARGDSQEVTLTPELTKSLMPDFGVALGTDNYQDNLNEMLPALRASENLKLKNYSAALRDAQLAYQRTNERMAPLAYRYLDTVAKALDGLGRHQKAAKARAEYEAGRAKDLNAGPKKK